MSRHLNPLNLPCPRLPSMGHEDYGPVPSAVGQAMTDADLALFWVQFQLRGATRWALQYGFRPWLPLP